MTTLDLNTATMGELREANELEKLFLQTLDENYSLEELSVGKSHNPKSATMLFNYFIPLEDVINELRVPAHAIFRDYCDGEDAEYELGATFEEILKGAFKGVIMDAIGQQLPMDSILLDVYVGRVEYPVFDDEGVCFDEFPNNLIATLHVTIPNYLSQRYANVMRVFQPIIEGFKQFDRDHARKITFLQECLDASNQPVEHNPMFDEWVSAQLS